ncbi:MAG: phosphosulfolactate synthase [Bacteroidales bacterium]|nr:phosphosulfolactate synthase [Bacteroidales bacterium]
MNFPLSFTPNRENKPRKAGQTMVIDKGLTCIEAEGMAQDAGDYIDYVKLGFGTSLVTKNLQKKIDIYKNNGITPYFGGTLFELFIVRGQFNEYQKFLEQYGVNTAEVSDGSMFMPTEDKLNYIKELKKNFNVISEVGSKDASVDIPIAKWIESIKAELEAGSQKVITEARESGTIGIYKKDGSPNTELIDTIIKNFDSNQIMWEAPNKPQQAMFIKMLGANVNLGNVATNEVIALEALRMGFRGDTFFQFLPENLKQK